MTIEKCQRRNAQKRQSSRMDRKTDRTIPISSNLFFISQFLQLQMIQNVPKMSSKNILLKM